MQNRGWKSRKLLCALLGAALPVLNTTFGWGLPVEAIITSVCSLFGYVAGETAVDMQRVRAKG